MALPNTLNGQVYNITVASLAAKSPFNGGSIGLMVIPFSTQQTDASDAAPKMATGDVKYGDLSVHSYFTMNDWSGGEGQRDYGDQTKILTSSGVDLRFTGHAFCGPNMVSTAASPAAGNPILAHLRFTSPNNTTLTYRYFQDKVQYFYTVGNAWDDTLADTVNLPKYHKGYGNKLFLLTNGAYTTHWTLQTTWTNWSVPSLSKVTRGLEVYNNLLWMGCHETASGGDVYLQGMSLDTNGVPIYDAASDKYFVGTRQAYINNIKEYANQLYVGKDDGLYTIDFNDNYARKVYSCNYNGNNFNVMEIFNGELYFNIENGLYKFNGSDMLKVGWDRPNYLPTNRQGHATSALATEDFLYVAIQGDSTTFSSVMAYNGRGWTTIYVASAVNTQIGALCYDPSGATYDKIYFAEGTASYYFNILRYAPNPKNVNVASWFKSGGAFESSWFDAGLIKIPKVLRSFSGFGENFSTTYYIKLEYKLELDTNAWVVLNDATTGNNKITATEGEIIPSPAIQFKRVKFRVTFITDGAKTTSLEALAAKYYVRPPTLYSYSYQVIGSTDQMALTGWDNQTSAIIWAALESARETVTPISLVDDLGRTQTVLCTSVQRRANPLRMDDADPQPEQTITFNVVDI